MYIYIYKYMYVKCIYDIHIELRFFDPIMKVDPCLPYTRSNHCAIWPNDDTC